MASDNILLRSKKQRYKVVNFKTRETLAEGFTSQKAVRDWVKANKKENTSYLTVGYFE